MEPTSDQPTYLNAQAVADLLGLKVQTVHDYRNSGRLPPPDVMLGRVVYDSPGWLPETIAAYVAELKRNARVHRWKGEAS